MDTLTNLYQINKKEYFYEIFDYKTKLANNYKFSNHYGGFMAAIQLTGPWEYWIQQTSTTASTSSYIWDQWTGDIGYSTTSDSQTIYYPIWVNTQREYRANNPFISAVTRPYVPPTAEELAARRQEEEQRKQRKEAAEKAAEELLMSHMTPEQREMYQKMKRFHVISATGKRFEVDATRRMHNVFQLDEQGKRVVEHCIYQTGDTPQGDNLLAQKLLLEHDEAQFVAIANQRRLA